MKYTAMNNGLGDWRSIIGLVAAATMLYLPLAGCATSKPTPLPPAYRPADTVNLHFKRPLIIKTPDASPVTVEEHIRCGLFYFDQERFAEAADQFEEAQQRINDRRNPLNRACLISTAVCHLLTDNKPGFIKAAKELKSSYTQYELVAIEKMNGQVKAIFDLYDEFMKTGNY